MRLSRNPQLAGIKHLNRLEQVLARAEWQRDFAEGLMFDDKERLIEATASNVFLVSKGTLLTPELSEAGVEGVMRDTVLEYARQAGLHCEIIEISRARLDTADELFLTKPIVLSASGRSGV
jgi:4-amino-4-deoxychorismate lyase